MIDKEREQRILNEAYYMLATDSTVRKVAKAFGVSKSTVYMDVSKELSSIDYSLYTSVKWLLLKNKKERHIRGGISTKRKYQKLQK